MQMIMSKIKKVKTTKIKNGKKIIIKIRMRNIIILKKSKMIANKIYKRKIKIKIKMNKMNKKNSFQ
jgi:hypothetical protein